MRNRLWLGFVAVLALPGTSPTAARADFFVQKNLVSDIPGLALFTDPNLKNPWGISASGAGPFWVSDQVTGVATLYNTGGTPSGTFTIPGGGGAGGPTGQVFNTTSDFILGNGSRAVFIFAALNGTISGWNPGLGGTAQGQVGTGAAGSVYTGLALGTSALGSTLYAANDSLGKIDVFNKSFAPVALAGGFADPNLPSGYTPYNVQNLNGTLYVTYENETTGGGVVNAFDLNGNFLRRISANGAAGPLQSPWGVAIAANGFGSLGGKLLVGNENDGHISIFDPTSGAFLGQLSDGNGNVFANSGLWGLQFGNGGNGGSANVLYFAAGINDEKNGLFGSITAVPEPGSVALFGIGTLVLVVKARRKAASSSLPVA